MSKKLIIKKFFTLFSLFLFIGVGLFGSSIEITYGVSLKERLRQHQEQQNNGGGESKKKTSPFGSVTESVKDVTVEVKVENLEEEDPEPNVSGKIIWRDEKGKTYAIKYFNSSSYLVSFSKKIPRDQLYGTLEIIPNKGKAGEFVLDKSYTIELNYNKFIGTVTERRQLYYFQVKPSETDRRGYTLEKTYTQDEKDQENNTKVDTTKILTYEGTFSIPINGIKIGFYEEDGVLIREVTSDSNGKFSMVLDPERFDFNRTYNLIYGKTGDIEKGIYGILYEGKKYKFKNVQDLYEQFEGNHRLDVKRNDKDIIKKEPFPYIFAIILVIIYLVVVFIIYVSLIKRIFYHPIKNKTSAPFLWQSRKAKILNIKKELGIDTRE